MGQKTEIVLSRKNIRALTFVMEVLQETFGKDIQFFDTLIHKKNKVVDSYEIKPHIWVPNLGRLTFLFKFSFDKPDSFLFLPEPDGQVSMGLISVELPQNIVFICKRGKFEITPEVKKVFLTLAKL